MANQRIRRQRETERKFAIHPTLYPSSGAIAVSPVAFLFVSRAPLEDNEHNYGELFVLEITQ